MSEPTSDPVGVREAPTAEQVFDLIRRMSVEERRSLFHRLEHRHNTLMAPTGFGILPTAFVDALMNFYRQVTRALCDTTKMAHVLAMGKRGKSQLKRDNEIVRLRDKEHQTFGQIPKSLFRANRAWSKDGKLLSRDVVEKAYSRRKKELAQAEEVRAALERFGAVVANFEEVLGPSPDKAKPGSLPTVANVPGDEC